MTQQKIISSYLRQVKRNCPFSIQKKLINDLKNHLFDYFDDNPCSTFEDITNHFGAPEKFADEYLLAMDKDARKKAIQKTKWVKWSFLVGVTAIVFIIAVTAVWMLIEISQKREYHYYEYITENSIE